MRKTVCMLAAFAVAALCSAGIDSAQAQSSDVIFDGSPVLVVGSDAIDAEPNNPRMGNVRGEQSELRRRLLRNRLEAPCSVCGEVLPEHMLVAAHIKKRSKCSRQEKLDPQVVVLMCKLGCDALYEYGYLSVANGIVTTRHRATDPEKITQLLGRLNGRDFLEWTLSRSRYFDWHIANVLRSG